MNLGKEPRKQRMVTREVVSAEPLPEPELIFDPETEIPKELWAAFETYLAIPHAVTQKPDQMPILLLALIDARLQRKIKQHPELSDDLRTQIERGYDSQNRFSRDAAALDSLVKIAMYRSVGAEVDLLQPPRSSTFEDLLQMNLNYIHNFGLDLMFLETFRRFEALLQLFPDRKVEILAAAEQVGLPEKGAQLITQAFMSNPQQFALYLAPQAVAFFILVFPNQREKLSALLQPFWEKTKEDIALYQNDLIGYLDGSLELGPSQQSSARWFESYMLTVVSATLLSKAGQCTPDRRLEILPKPSKLKTNQATLPNRPIL